MFKIKLFAQLAAELDAVTGAQVQAVMSRQDVKETDRVLGTVDPETAKLWFLVNKRYAALFELQAEAILGGPDKWPQLTLRADRLKREIKTLTNLFWLSVEDSLEVPSDADGFEVRKDWKVIERTHEDPGVQMLKRIFGEALDLEGLGAGEFDDELFGRQSERRRDPERAH